MVQILPDQKVAACDCNVAKMLSIAACFLVPGQLRLEQWLLTFPTPGAPIPENNGLGTPCL